jgi:hypothetical protein
MDQLEQRAGRTMRKRRARTAGERGSHVAPVAGQELWWRKRVDAAVDAMEAAGGGTILDSAGRQTEIDCLVELEHPMLRDSQPRQRPIRQRLDAKPRVFRVFSSSPIHGLSVAAKSSRVGDAA